MALETQLTMLILGTVQSVGDEFLSHPKLITVPGSYRLFSLRQID